MKFRNLWNDAKQHPVVLIVIAVVVGFIAYNLYQNYKNNQSQNNGLATSGSPGGYTMVNEYYQAVPTGTTTVTNPLSGATGNLGQQNGVTGITPNTNKNIRSFIGVPSTNGALIKHGSWPSGTPMKFGQTLTVNGTTYTIGPGSNGVVWGVPGTGWSLNDWNRVPLGQKVLLYQ